MTLETYLKNKTVVRQDSYRPFCQQCRLAKAVCDCERLRPFSTETEFVILMHPEESRRRIATGRMTHLLITNSRLITGESFGSGDEVKKLLNDPTRECVVLYPGKTAVDLAKFGRSSSSPSLQRLTVFVLDGTWRTAKKMLRLSPDLQQLPQICLLPPDFQLSESASSLDRTSIRRSKPFTI